MPKCNPDGWEELAQRGMVEMNFKKRIVYVTWKLERTHNLQRIEEVHMKHEQMENVRVHYLPMH